MHALLQLLGKKGLALLSLESRESDGFVILHFLTSSAIQIVINHVLNGLMQVAGIMCLLPFLSLSCGGNWHLKHSNQVGPVTSLDTANGQHTHTHTECSIAH